MFDREIVEKMLLKNVPVDCKCEFVDYQPLVENRDLDGYITYIEDLSSSHKSSFTNENVTSIFLDFIKKMNVKDIKIIRDSLTILEYIEPAGDIPNLKYKFNFRCKIGNDT
jgi:hypothetical protein